jgi:hypothetical protein
VSLIFPVHNFFFFSGAQPTFKQYMQHSTGSVVNEPQMIPHAYKNSNALNFRVIEQELCLLKVQYMLMEDYVDYLQKIGLTLLKIRLVFDFGGFLLVGS